MSDIDFSISTEGLVEKGNAIAEQAKEIESALHDIDDARKSLDGWVSANRARYDAKLANALPKMEEMVEVIDSYSKVAVQTSNRIVDVETLSVGLTVIHSTSLVASFKYLSNDNLFESDKSLLPILM